MRRYEGQTLGNACRIAVVANDAIGNFVVGTPLLTMLRETHQPEALDYYGGSRTSELAMASDLIDFCYPLHGSNPMECASVLSARLDQHEYDLVVNMEWTSYASVMTGVLSGSNGYVCGPCIGPGGRANLPFGEDVQGDLWRDQEWIAPDLTSKYPFLKSGFIGEIFCRLAYLEGEVPRYQLPISEPTISIPDVIVAPSASLEDKLWPVGDWITAINHLVKSGASVGVVGAAPKVQKEFWKGNSTEQDLIDTGNVVDLRGKLTLPEVVGAIKKAKMVFTLDNGILHLAAATETPIVGLFRYGIHRLWAPPVPGIEVLTPKPEEFVRDIALDSVLPVLDEVLSQR